ncbi:nucleotidyltransferase [Geomonas sp. Red276]
MTDLDIRWQQRFLHFKRACLLLKQAVGIENPSVIERAGLVNFYERCLEQSCKLIKDYGEAEGSSVQSPRHGISLACQRGFLSQEQDWLAALESRKLTLRIHDEAIASRIDTLIREKYFYLLHELFCTISNKLPTEVPQ